MNNFELLSPPAPLALVGRQEFIAQRSLPKDYNYMSEKKTVFRFTCLQSCFLDMLLFHHLGAPPLIQHAEIADQALTVIREYYTTDWFRNDIDEYNCMKKEKGNRHFEWYRFLTGAVLLGLLAEDAEVIELVADYPESWFVPETMARPIDSSLGHLYISVVAAFRSKPLDGQAEMEESIRKNRKKAPKVLFSAWEAARSGNQALFEEHLRSSVILFEKQLPEDLCNEDELIAFPHSTILAAARRIGMQLPKFEPRIMARLLTSESVGFK